MRKYKNKILKGAFKVSVLGLFIGGSCLDGENIIVPLVILGLSLIYIAIFTAANTRG